MIIAIIMGREASLSSGTLPPFKLSFNNNSQSHDSCSSPCSFLDIYSYANMSSYFNLKHNDLLIHFIREAHELSKCGTPHLASAWIQIYSFLLGSNSNSQTRIVIKHKRIVVVSQ
jgi:hypothetical protein